MREKIHASVDLTWPTSAAQQLTPPPGPCKEPFTITKSILGSYFGGSFFPFFFFPRFSTKTWIELKF